ALRAAGEAGAARGGPAALDAARAVLDAADGVDLDYLELALPDLSPLPADVAADTEARLLVAARVGATRLIDNLPLTLAAVDGAHPRDPDH
ncbi:pantoate--beta-alanine ligase, partial [Nocardioides dongxiaopingii]